MNGIRAAHETSADPRSTKTFTHPQVPVCYINGSTSTRSLWLYTPTITQSYPSSRSLRLATGTELLVGNDHVARISPASVDCNCMQVVHAGTAHSDNESMTSVCVKNVHSGVFNGIRLTDPAGIILVLSFFCVIKKVLPEERRLPRVVSLYPPVMALFYATTASTELDTRAVVCSAEISATPPRSPRTEVCQLVGHRYNAGSAKY
ncbi:hypothetical protein EDC04DRAFT_2672360 [Pisolithus marmoratus]|nr:hypothetical protein EDC04DRAFT_2672360 [Pisolithus marmoratus]